MISARQLFCSAFLTLALAACSTLPPVATPPATGPGQRHEAAEALFHALATLDIDDRYGGSTRASGFDCSGLVVHVYREAFGMVLPREAKDQARVGRRVDAARLEPGDLVFYNTLGEPFSHVGIYIGDGRFVHAPRSGAAVRVENMRSRYWVQRFDGARRLVGLQRAAATP